MSTITILSILSVCVQYTLALQLNFTKVPTGSITQHDKITVKWSTDTAVLGFVQLKLLQNGTVHKTLYTTYNNARSVEVKLNPYGERFQLQLHAVAYDNSEDLILSDYFDINCNGCLNTTANIIVVCLFVCLCTCVYLGIQDCDNREKEREQEIVEKREEKCNEKHKENTIVSPKTDLRPTNPVGSTGMGGLVLGSNSSHSSDDRHLVGMDDKAQDFRSVSLSSIHYGEGDESV